jgi:DNA-binding NtrC family response regulator
MKKRETTSTVGKSKAQGRLDAKTRVVPLRVLLVDDEPNVRQAIALMLGIDGHKVTESGSGLAALQNLAAHSFDIVITDYRMQGMNGDELACRIKALYPKTPVIMLTGFYDQGIGPRNPVCAIFHKPDGIKNLRDAMGRFCQN